MSSRSGSDSESNRSHSVSPLPDGPVPTPGHGLTRSTSNSPNFAHSPRSSPAKSAASRSSRSRSTSRSRSASPASNKSTASTRKSRSPSAASNRSRSDSSSSGSKKSRSRSPSAASRHSASPASRRSGSPASRHSASPASRHSASPASRRSGSPASRRSGSPASRHSASPASRRSGSPASRRSGSPASRHSASPASHHSASPASVRSGSPSLRIATPEKRGSDDEEDVSVKKKKRADGDTPKRAILSDSEAEDQAASAAPGEDVSAAAIFGDADDISSEEEKAAEGGRSDDERQSDDDRHEEPAKENEPEPIPETRIDVKIPKISCDLGKDIHFVKLPNFLSVETRPFDPETYEDEIDEEETLDEEGRARLKLKVENTIRWRDVMDKEGNVTKESNARLVKWSDGSYSLHLGSEIFDVYKQPLQGDHNHLFIRQGTGLQGQAVFRTKLSFRPHSTESFTHRKMTLSLADRSQKTSGIKILSQVGVDPDHDRKFLLKKEEEKLKQTVRVSKPRRKDTGARSHNSSLYREEEGSEEEGAISLNAIKNKYKSGAAAHAKGGAIYSSDEEGSDIENRRARKLDKAKVLKDSDTSEDSD